ncbi:MAG: hypothetical protein EBS19_00815 [Spirochaetia bacterium]|nr:hypothetical protein [Spirochaetia bacterium]
MADFLSDFGGSLKDKVLPNGDALKRKIDGQRETWLKGISSTKHGKKEDPTYLHFRFIFDFGDTTFLDPETFLPPSPLFRPMDKAKSNQAINNLAGDLEGTFKNGQIKDTGLRNDLAEVEERSKAGDFYSDVDFFYGSKFIINSRAQRGAFNINGGGVGYMGAQNFLFQRSIKRQQMLDAFKKGFKFINEKCPYYFQTLSGLDQILKVDIKNLHKTGGKPQRMGTLTIDCLESIDMRIFSLSELYRKAIYDYTYHRIMLPENLRKFRMWLVVSEIRNIQLSYGINDILNPFSIPSVAQGANFLDSFNSQTGLLDQAQGLLQKSTNLDKAEDKFGSYTLGPYAFIYQFDQCEFDFDDSYPSFTSIDNKGGAAVTNKFKIHVGRVKDYKIQFNSLADIMQKDDGIEKMVLADVWGSRKSEYSDYDYTGTEGIKSVTFDDKANPAEYFAQLASNFITNSVADLKDQGVQVLQGALLGNIYGLGGFNPRSQFRSYTNFDDINAKASPLKIPDPRKDNSPQGSGLGGPGQRQYPEINEDAYTGVPSTTQENLGTAYSGTPGNPGTASGDVYPNNPGSDLGLPDRQYPAPGGDEYKNVPGSDSGVPGRVYPLVKEDVYPTNPGADSGLPDRQYPIPGGDEFKDVPGSSLGVPNRVYPESNDDAYSTNPGADLGLPDRQYPPINEDVYPDSQSVETDNIGKIYPDSSNSYGNVNEKEYKDSQVVSSDKNIGGVYPDAVNRYPEINEKVYKESNEIIDESLGEVYKQVKNVYPGVNDTQYGDSIIPNNSLNGDVYRGVPGRDLGVPGRNYESINDDQYDISNRPVNIANIGRVYPSSKK